MDWQDPRDELDGLFNDLLPARGMKRRDGQIALSRRLLDAMLDSDIALCDAGTGIGKTYAYLAAGVMFLRFRRSCGLPFQPIIISTSSIALQESVRNEYIPFLSKVLLDGRVIDQPLDSVIRKGRRHYVCDELLKWRLREIRPEKMNRKDVRTLRRLWESDDVGETDDLKNYDMERVRVPEICRCQSKTCRYRKFLDRCNDEPYPFHICNHHLLLADRVCRSENRKPILPEHSALMIDEAHKLPETVRQTLGVTLKSGDLKIMERMLRDERRVREAEALAESSAPLKRKLSEPPTGEPFESYARLLVGPEKVLSALSRNLRYELTLPVLKRLDRLRYAIETLLDPDSEKVRYATDSEDGKTTELTAEDADLSERMRRILWSALSRKYLVKIPML